MEIKYQAFDGKLFDTEEECVKYECSTCESVIVLDEERKEIPFNQVIDCGFFVKVKDETGVTILQNLGCKEITKIGTYIWTEGTGGFISIEDILNAFEKLE